MERLTQQLRQLTRKLFPDLISLPPNRQEQALLAMTYFYFLLPLFVVGVVWLWLVTDWSILVGNWGILLFLLILTSLINQRPFVFPIALTDSVTLPFSASLSSLLSMMVLLVFGPGALWLMWIVGFGSAISAGWQDRKNNLPFLFALNNFVQSSGTSILILLVAGTVFTATGGSYPFRANSLAEWLPSIWAILALSAAPTVIYFLPTWSVTIQSGQSLNRHTFFRLMGGGTLISLLTTPFALPLAQVYDAENLPLFVMFCLAVAGANMLAYFFLVSSIY